MAVPLVVIVGADKGGVGKTLVSRAILDFFKASNKECRAFDTEIPHGVLYRFYPSTSAVVDLTTSDGQMMVFDNISQSAVTVIDVRANLLSPALKTLSEIGFLEMVRNGEIRIVVLHVIGSSIASLNEIKRTAALMEGAQHLIVKNHINDSVFFDGIKAVDTNMINNETVIDIPKLDERSAEFVEASSLPFATFVNDQTQSRVIRGKVQHWLGLVFKEFEKAKLV